jgi:hypothetical protein
MNTEMRIRICVLIFEGDVYLSSNLYIIQRNGLTLFDPPSPMEACCLLLSCLWMNQRVLHLTLSKFLPIHLGFRGEIPPCASTVTAYLALSHSISHGISHGIPHSISHRSLIASPIASLTPHPSPDFPPSQQQPSRRLPPTPAPPPQSPLPKHPSSKQRPPPCPSAADYSASPAPQTRACKCPDCARLGRTPSPRAGFVMLALALSGRVRGGIGLVRLWRT